jgi:hypothetical protein
MRWVLANGIAGVADTIIHGRISFSVDLIATGGAVGIMQGVALRWPIRLVALWMLVTAAGGLFGGIAGGALRAVVGGRLGFATGLIVAGATVGTIQVLVPTRQIPNSEWWIVANAVAGVLGGVAGHETLERLGGIVGAVVGRVVGGTVVGVVTGLTLTQLLQNPAGKK